VRRLRVLSEVGVARRFVPRVLSDAVEHKQDDDGAYDEESVSSPRHGGQVWPRLLRSPVEFEGGKRRDRENGMTKY
jgi:hypothetical protein